MRWQWVGEELSQWVSKPRPAIPRDVARAVKIEAGHRCAVPTCRQTSGLEVHHIVGYAKVKKHEIDNLMPSSLASIGSKRA